MSRIHQNIIAILLIITNVTLSYSQNKKSGDKSKSTPLKLNSEFDYATFYSPSNSFGPMARWWWPGNDVEKKELKREIELFSKNGFAGVEIQPMNLGIPKIGDNLNRVKTWDTESYYDNLRFVIEQVNANNMFVDLTNGSGWPPGGPHLSVEDGFRSLVHTDTTVVGGKKISIKLPQPKTVSGAIPLLQSVLAVKTFGVAENNSTTNLDAKNIQVISSQRENKSINFEAPVGNWRIIAFWSVPSGEMTNIAASETQGPVLDHLDSTKVVKNYEHFLGKRTALAPYFGDGLRAVFNDSYEFKADRHYSSDFLSYFKKHRGYDITPWLPATMQKGYNMVEFMNPHAEPDFKFSDQDWRIQYDYDLTVADLLREHFFETSLKYLNPKGLLHRTQGYGLKMDIIRMAGEASIPETESMNGSEAILKLTTSGANLYNRPIISAESVVFIDKVYTTTPQTIRLAVDKLFAAGVNQIVYHGIPYRYFNEKTAPIGWYPFSFPFISGINFSSNLGEGNPFWKYQHEVNNYVSRTQYALRSGKPKVDVLIYFPFLSFHGIADNPTEIFNYGSLEKVDKKNFSEKDNEAKAIYEWSKSIWPLINKMEESGLTWNWVNDESLQNATTENGKLLINSNSYEALILPSLPEMQLATAESIQHLAKNGLKLLVYGKLPEKQPSFLNWEVNDVKTKKAIENALQFDNSMLCNSVENLAEWVQKQKFNQTIEYRKNYSQLRQVTRELENGNQIRFFWNTSANWETIELKLDSKFKSATWLNAEDGSAFQDLSNQITRYTIAPYSSILLYAETTLEKTKYANSNSDSPQGANPIIALNQWNIEADTLQLKNVALFDWKTDEKWKYQGEEAKYSTVFKLKKLIKGKKYLLDLGKVCYSAEINLNKQLIGTKIYSPFIIDVTNFIKKGENTLEIKVTPTLLNSFIGKSANNNIYRQFKNKEAELMEEGLIGPVRILEK